MLQQGYRLPPRLFTRHSITEIAKNIKKQKFILRFAEESDKRFALLRLTSLCEKPETFTNRRQTIGSHQPALSVFFDIAETLRGLIKIGVNLIAAYCRKTPVNPETFNEAVHIIRGDRQVTRLVMATNGFVRPAGLEDIKTDSGSHSFRLMYSDRRWTVYSSFFGGRIGACVYFPGVNYEDWNTLDIIAPIKSKEWTVKESRLLKPMRIKIEWNESSKLCPSLKLQRSQSAFQVEVVKTKRKKPSGEET